MANQRQGAAYLSFQGGLNTQASDLNAAPADARDMLNTVITDSGTLRRRAGFDLLPNLDTSTLFLSDTTDYTAETSTFVDPSPAGVEFKVVKSDGALLRVVILHLGTSIYLYNVDELPTIEDLTNCYQRFSLSDTWNSKYKYTKTRFVQDSNRVYLVNPYMPLSFIAYDEDLGRFIFETEDVRYRDLSADAEVDERVTVNSKTYRCIKPHTPKTSNAPPTGDEWQEYWVLEGKAPASGAPAAWAAKNGTWVSVLEDTRTDTCGEITSTLYDYSHYKCILDHTAGSSSEPGVGGSWETYWVLEARTTTSYSSTTMKRGRLRGPWYPEWVTGSTYYDAVTAADIYTGSVKKKGWDNSNDYPAGFSAGVMAQGRLWLANILGERNIIYFSQAIIEDIHYTKMHQFADPLNPEDPDVVDSDGGHIKLTAADDIVGIADYLGGVLVLATNGIWYINGPDGFFNATSYNIKKVSDDGCMGRFTWAPVENGIIYCSLSGVYSISLDDIGSAPVVTEISQKIKDLWTGIPHAQRRTMEVVYNPDRTTLYIAGNFTTPVWFNYRNPYEQANRKRDFLLLHTKLGAWYKHGLSSDADASKLTVGTLAPIAVNLSDFSPVTVGGVAVEVGGTAVTVPDGVASATTVTLCVFMKQNGTGVDWSIGHTDGSTKVDFSRSSADAETNSAYYEPVPQIFGDAGHRKQAPYLYAMFEPVETGFNSTTGEFINPGGCYYRALWDWVNSNSSPKWGDATQAYKPTKFNFVTEDGDLYPHSVVRSKNKVRGSGPALSIRFESEDAKDFHLLGWQLQVAFSQTV